MDKTIITIGRLIFGISIGVFGVFNLINENAVILMVPGFMPGNDSFWVYFVGICLVTASVSIISNRAVGLSCKLLALLLFVFDITIHIPDMLEPETVNSGLFNFLRDTTIAGAAIVFSNIFRDDETVVDAITKIKKEVLESPIEIE